jgi:hypothetical protein
MTPCTVKSVEEKSRSFCFCFLNSKPISKWATISTESPVKSLFLKNERKSLGALVLSYSSHCCCSYNAMPSADSCEACRVPGLEHVLATGTYQVGIRKKTFSIRFSCALFRIQLQSVLGFIGGTRKVEMAPQKG